MIDDAVQKHRRISTTVNLYNKAGLVQQYDIINQSNVQGFTPCMLRFAQSGNKSIDPKYTEINAAVERDLVTQPTSCSSDAVVKVSTTNLIELTSCCCSSFFRMIVHLILTSSVCHLRSESLCQLCLMFTTDQSTMMVHFAQRTTSNLQSILTLSTTRISICQ